MQHIEYDFGAIKERIILIIERRHTDEDTKNHNNFDDNYTFMLYIEYYFGAIKNWIIVIIEATAAMVDMAIFKMLFL